MSALGRTARAIVAVVALGLTASGCGTATEEYSTAPGDVVLRMHELQGFLRPGEPAAIVPTFTMYGDGRAIMLAPRGVGSLPELRELRIPQIRVEEIVDHALDADVLDDPESGTEIMPDASISLVTLNALGQSGTAELGPEANGDLQELREAMLGYAAKPEAVTYDPKAIAVLATPVKNVDADTAWTLGALGEESLDQIDGAYCRIYRGADAQSVMEEAQQAAPTDIWYSGEAVYAVAFRPLLPDEDSCSSLSTRTRTNE